MLLICVVFYALFALLLTILVLFWVDVLVWMDWLDLCCTVIVLYSFFIFSFMIVGVIVAVDFVCCIAVSVALLFLVCDIVIALSFVIVSIVTSIWVVVITLFDY